MPVKIRLARRGRKFAKIYSIVVADSRAPRDGRYIETLGQYNPNTNPATISLDFEKSLEWLQKGAQPTDTCRAILSHKGVMYKKHLLDGVRKGAFDEAEAEKRFQTWTVEKDSKNQAELDKLNSVKDAAAKERFEAESKINEARLLEIEKMKSQLLAEAEAANAPAEETAPAEEVAPAEEAKEEPKAEEAAPAAKEEPKAEEAAPAAEEVKEEAKKEEAAPATKEVKEEPKAEEAKEEPKAEEAKKEEKKEDK